MPRTRKRCPLRPASGATLPIPVSYKFPCSFRAWPVRRAGFYLDSFFLTTPNLLVQKVFFGTQSRRNESVQAIARTQPKLLQRLVIIRRCAWLDPTPVLLCSNAQHISHQRLRVWGAGRDVRHAFVHRVCTRFLQKSRNLLCCQVRMGQVRSV